MGLGSVMQTALTGMSAAESSIAYSAHNLANAETDGFKASRPIDVTLGYDSQSLGSARTGASGGTNPRQVGLGVRAAGSSVDFRQGAIAWEKSSSSLALQGDGFFLVEGAGGERAYTRDGNFSLNGRGDLVTAAGDHVMGHTVDEDFHLQTQQLSPLRIPLGRQAQSADGSAATLVSYSVGSNGRIHGEFSDGLTRDLGQIRLAKFANPSGLSQRAGNVYAAGVNSGLPLESDPGEAGAADIVAGATELSNTDMGHSLIEMNLAEFHYRANARVVGAADSLLEELLNLDRR